MLTSALDRFFARWHKPKSIEEIRKEVDDRYDAVGEEVAARFTRGNVTIQRGAFLMRDELEKRSARRTTR